MAIITATGTPTNNFNSNYVHVQSLIDPGGISAGFYLELTRATSQTEEAASPGNLIHLFTLKTFTVYAVHMYCTLHNKRDIVYWVGMVSKELLGIVFKGIEW